MRLACVGLSLLAWSGRFGAVLRLHLDQVRSFLLAVKRGSSDDGAAVRVDAEELRVSALILQDDIVDLETKEEQDAQAEEEEEEFNKQSLQVRSGLTVPCRPESRSVADT